MVCIHGNRAERGSAEAMVVVAVRKHDPPRQLGDFPYRSSEIPTLCLAGSCIDDYAFFLSHDKAAVEKQLGMMSGKYPVRDLDPGKS